MNDDNKNYENITPNDTNIITSPEQIEYILKNRKEIKEKQNNLDKKINNYIKNLNNEELIDQPKEINKSVEKLIEQPKEINKSVEKLIEQPKKINESVEELIEQPEEINEPVEELIEQPEEVNEPVEELIEQPEEVNEPVEELIEQPEEVNEPVINDTQREDKTKHNIIEPTNVINTTITPVAPIIDNTNNEIVILTEEEPVQKVFPRDDSNFRKDYIIFENVRKEYKNESLSTIALDDISFKIDEGELVIFLGQSGAGKSTALNMLGGMDSVTSGRIIVGDKEITNYDFDELTEYRRKDIGFIFQFYNLIPNLSAKENIELSTEITTDSIDANLILERVGLKEGIDKFPSQLSGGEQQRVAIARAIAKKPKLLLCDEPTGALDYKTGKQILKLLQETCRNNKITTIIITHNQAITPMADKVIYFNSGKVVDVKINKYPVDIEGIEW